MNTTRLPIVILTAALLSTAFLVLFTYRSTINAVGSSPSQTGMGDLHRYDAQQSNASDRTLFESSPYVGMGELRRFEAPVNSRPVVGIGVLRRFEAEQALATTNVRSYQLSDRVCPNQGTQNGERDAGASAPIYVLLAKGC